MNANRSFTRRSFLKSSLAAGAVVATASCATSAKKRVSANERIAIGCIGVGDRGSYVMGSALGLPEAHVVAVCDVKRDRREKAKAGVDEVNGNSDCAAYNNFEDLVARNDIDACIIASCDHWHVPLALAAIRAGKDVYLEKPMGLSVEQDATLRKEVHRKKAIFQFGTQQRSDAKFRKACELVQNGSIGKLKTIHVWSAASSSGGPTELAPVPDTLDYDRWLGPAPKVPYTLERDSNKWWWFISDYALGFIAGWGIHPVDIAVWGGGDLLKTNVRVEGSGVFPTEGVCNTATAWDVTLAYDSGVTMRFYSQPAPEELKARYGKIIDHGTAFEGSDGWVCVDRQRIQASSDAILKAEIPGNGVHLLESNHHVKNFLEGVRTRQSTVSSIDEAVQGDTVCQISDIAIRLKRPLRWDYAKEQFLDDKEANGRLTRAMREPWHL
ncbi:MAG: Gfo/Idh/MocA family oxidoreductase [Candidatus Hydrogenedentes bacterium]|nr:Gfo/Idh/MocA family oxidoreductase [Candidatus Hydrogenedentota bacterium]